MIKELLSKYKFECKCCNKSEHFGLGWSKVNGELFCRKCWPKLPPVVEWYEKRYETLCGCLDIPLGKKTSLFKPLGLSESHVKVDDAKWLTKTIIDHLALKGDVISFQFRKMENQIAGSVRDSGSGYVVEMSCELQDNYTALSAIIIHELMHIFCDRHSLMYKDQAEYEELVDLSCILLGFGVPMLNAKRAFNVERRTLSGASEDGCCRSYFSIGYLTDAQIGFAFACFAKQNNMSLKEVWGYLSREASGILSDGFYLEKRVCGKVLARRTTTKKLANKKVAKELCSFNCPVCSLSMKVSRETMNEVKVLKVICSKCSTKIFYDGEKVLKHIEFIRTA